MTQKDMLQLSKDFKAGVIPEETIKEIEKINNRSIEEIVAYIDRIFLVKKHHLEVMTISREFAQKHYSEIALEYATLKDDKYIWYFPDGSASPVVFETPRLFYVFHRPVENPQEAEPVMVHPLSSQPHELLNNLVLYTYSYLEKKGITEINFSDIYKQNFEIGK